MSITLRFANAPLGHEVQGVDLAHLSQQQFDDIERAFDAYGVIVFRGQKLTPDEQIEFSRKFGKLEKYPIGDFLLPGKPEIFVVSNIIENGKPIGMADAGSNWHSDMAFTEKPPRGSALYALEVPVGAEGRPLGDTLLASASAAYDALPEETKNEIAGLKVINSFSRFAAAKQATTADGKKTQEERERARNLHPDVVHPLVRIHPRSGRKCLYISGPLSTGIVGMDDAKATALLDRLRAHMTKPEFVYRHSWKAGDLIMWDNCSTIHMATSDYQLPLRRRMHRTTIEGVLTS